MPVIERAGKLPRGSMTGVVDSLDVDMAGDTSPIRTLMPLSPRSYREAVERALR